jgi:hypothetical protein
MIDSAQLCVVASWDDAHMDRAEIEGHLDSLLDVVGKITDLNNWNKPARSVTSLGD